MNTLSYYLIFSLTLLLTLGCDGCNEFDRPRGEECTFYCQGGALDCENGYCVCQSGDIELRPGFCLVGSFAHTFITYDTYGTCFDTTVIGFDEDPYNPTWQDGVEMQVIDGYIYEQLQRIGGFGGSPGWLFRTGNSPTAPVDSVWFYPIYGADGTADHAGRCRVGEWVCGTFFEGRFTDPNTIVGIGKYHACNTRDGRPEPENLYETFPITFHRYIE